jgi:putative flippase GtrA
MPINFFRKKVNKSNSFKAKKKRAIINFNSQFIRFAIVGGFCAALNLISLYVLTSLLKINYMLSTLIALIGINFLGFYLNKYYTFETDKSRFWQELWKYYSVMFSSFLLNLFFMYLLVDIFKMWYIYASITITIGFIIYNFLMHKNWSFK